MKRYTAAELDLMANLVASEMADRFVDNVLQAQRGVITAGFTVRILKALIGEG